MTAQPAIVEKVDVVDAPGAFEVQRFWGVIPRSHLIQRSPKLPKGGGPSFCILGDCCFDPLSSSQFDPSSPTGSPPRHEASPLVNTLAKWLPMTRTFPWPVLSSEVGYLHET